jgi:hypothetical protein
MPLLATWILHMCCFYPARRYRSSAHLCVTDKPKHQKGAHNVFVDDRGFPDKTKHYKALLCNVEGGIILQKLKHPAPPLDEVDPLFFCTYD